MARACWEASSWWEIISNLPHLPIPEFLVAILFDKLCKDEFECFIVLLWFIWRERNNIVRENPVCDAPNVFKVDGSFLFEFQQVKVAIDEQQRSAPEEIAKWSPPEKDTLKLNVDATLFHDVGHIGVGALVRDDMENVVWACSKMLVVDCNAFIIELLALREALELANDVGLLVSCIESDCNNAIEVVNCLGGYSYEDLIASKYKQIITCW